MKTDRFKGDEKIKNVFLEILYLELLKTEKQNQLLKTIILNITQHLILNVHKCINTFYLYCISNERIFSF